MSSTRSKDLLVIRNLPYTYFVRKFLGEGGYGATYKAKSYNEETGAVSDVAIKFIYPTDNSDVVGAEEISKYKQVASRATTVGITGNTCHVNLLCYYDSGIVLPDDPNYLPISDQIKNFTEREFDNTKGIIYIVTEFLTGKDLYYVIEDNHRAKTFPDLSEVKNFLHDILTGLEYMHLRSIAHLDIKPENIIRNDTGRYVLIDFGLSCSTRTCRPITTRGYMTNELLIMRRAQKSSDDRNMPFIMAAAADLFALGLTLQNYAASGTYLIEPEESRLYKTRSLRQFNFNIDWLDYILDELLFDYNYYADPRNSSSVNGHLVPPISQLLFVVDNERLPSASKPGEVGRLPAASGAGGVNQLPPPVDRVAAAAKRLASLQI